MPVHDWTRVEAGIFHDFHFSWVFRLRDALNSGLLPRAYYALAEQRAGSKEPDVLTLQRGASTTRSSAKAPGIHDLESGTVALAEAPPQVAFVEDLDDEFYVSKRRSIAIRHVTGDDLIALIEIMSPGNKSSRTHIDQFVENVVIALQTGIHVLVIDLHPPTSRDPTGIHGVIGRELGREHTAFDPRRPLTLVSYRANGQTRAYVQPTAVGEALHVMPLFLSEFRYVNTPLEETYSAAFQSVLPHIQEQLA